MATITSLLAATDENLIYFLNSPLVFYKPILKFQTLFQETFLSVSFYFITFLQNEDAQQFYTEYTIYVKGEIMNTHSWDAI